MQSLRATPDHRSLHRENLSDFIMRVYTVYLHALHALLRAKLRNLLRDQRRHGIHIARAVVVRGNYRVDHVFVSPLLWSPGELLVQHAQTGPACRDGELWI